MRKITTLFFSLIITLGYGQSITNQDKLGTGKFFQPSSATFLSDGSILYASSTDDSLTSGDKTVMGYGGSDAWLVKMSYNHQIDWQVCYGGSNDEFLTLSKELPNGNIIVAGSSRSPISGTKSSPHFGEDDIWLMLIDSQGNKVWEESYGGDNVDYPTDIVYYNNHFYLLGTSNSGATGNKTSTNYGQDDLWLLKLDMTGQVIWQKTLGGNLTEYIGYITIYNNKIYISSTSFSPPSGNKTSVNYAEDDCWLIKLDTNGNVINQKTIGGDLFDVGGPLKVLNDKLFLIYESYSEISGTKTTPNYGSVDGQLIILDTNFNIENQWAFGGNASDFLIDFNFFQDELFIIGASNSEISGNKTVEPHSDGTSSNFDWDLWFISFDTLTEQFNYQSSIGGNKSEVSAFVEIANPNNIKVVTISWSENTGDKTIPLTSHTGQSMYFEFWTFDYTYNLGIDKEKLTQNLNIYPNPFENTLHLKEEFANTKVEFYDALGSLVFNTKSNDLGTIETTNLPEGLYIVKMTDVNGKIYTARVVKQ
ncbi:Por secretion system C-terminal sorting domain-containing protein [Lishizhenia tianjinensis]|uniref:Por secretion system C-terminal sorting domain-containing protein n=1 Tax=Lishizhenia tianjinensis TaxID=477690 RepID=A0A1I6ZPV5_9FLAO|nr:T9SS type A sorting domain-containing protein [Lishizhenia tianjinensis]SFT64667.1 Por secretion system C-terminal sorting domain-containing protein [Lishizhenia tianjinensis]